MFVTVNVTLMGDPMWMGAAGGSTVIENDGEAGLSFAVVGATCPKQIGTESRTNIVNNLVHSIAISFLFQSGHLYFYCTLVMTSRDSEDSGTGSGRRAKLVDVEACGMRAAGYLMVEAPETVRVAATNFDKAQTNILTSHRHRPNVRPSKVNPVTG